MGCRTGDSALTSLGTIFIGEAKKKTIFPMIYDYMFQSLILVAFFDWRFALFVMVTFFLFVQRNSPHPFIDAPASQELNLL